MIVQMAGLGQESMGRFGNQIFAYFFLKLVEKELGCEIRTPPWMGETLFGIVPSAPLLPHEAAITFEAPGDEQGATFEHAIDRNRGPAPELQVIARYRDEGCRVLDIQGYYQYHTASVAQYRSLYRETFRINPLLLSQFDQALSKQPLSDPTLVCIHIRRGDYLQFKDQHPLFWSVSENAIVATINDLMASSLRNALIYVCSDDITHCTERFQALGVPCFTNAQLFSNLDASAALITDFIMMTRAQVLLIANSSLSFSAATLNDQGRIFLRPSPREDRYIPFVPWNSHVLLPKHPYHY